MLHLCDVDRIYDEENNGGKFDIFPRVDVFFFLIGCIGEQV